MKILNLTILILSTLFINACDETINVRKQHADEVVNIHGEITNIEALNAFIEQVNYHRKAKVKYVRYGIEGQRGVMTLSFEDKELNVSHSVDGKFIEDFKCKNIKIEKTDTTNKYILNQCTGDFEVDHELFSTSKTQ